MVTVLAAGCADNNTTTPPVVVRDAAFVGYTDTATKQTTCGNCHIGMQARWADTKHASAWADLQASGHASASCNKCHTTNGATNGHADTTAGYFKVASEAKPFYQDVQCESCHGAGSVHVTAPDSVQPLPSIMVDTGMNTGCGTCHSGAHDPFLEEWRSTTHGVVNSHANGNASCAGCHNGTAALTRFDGNAHFTDQTSSTWTPITCSVCHDPHGSSNPAQLTQSISVADTSANLCMRCHQRNSVPALNSTRLSPHSPQGPILVGTAGWKPAGFTWDAAANTPTHGNPAINTRLCAGCHVNGFSGKNDAGTTVYSMGHTFEATPCVTAGGAPDTTTSCSEDAKSFQACTVSGCHSSQAAARSAFEAVTARMTYYADILWKDSNGNGTLDTTDAGLLPIVKKAHAADWKSDTTITVAEGAQFNTAMFRMGGTGTHNPFYMEALAIATVQAVQTQYGVGAPPAAQEYIRTRQAAMRLRAQ